MIFACALGMAAFAGSSAMGQTSAPVSAANGMASDWATRGSDIPADPAWRFGTLPNGLRYAVRHSAQPQGAVSVRVRIGVGGLMEADKQQGWSHLIEHMVFRGTAHYADGEGVKLWQRLGASFGSDTNAQTTLTATTFQLDLPRADPASYREAMAVVADMMDSARFDPALLTTERHVVEAELAQRMSPLVRTLRDVQQPLFYAGTKAAKRDVIGTSETLAGATSAALRDYYETWYRPENAVVVVVGDADPAALEAGLRKAFGGWKREGRLPAAPDWGAPVTPTERTAIAANPQAPNLLLLDFVTPHRDQTETVARQQEQFAEAIAIGVLNQRLATQAQKGGAILNAGLQRVEQRHIEDQLLIQIQPRPGQWQAALREGYAVTNGLLATAPTQGEVDQQVTAITTPLAQRAASAATQTASTLANGLVTAVEEADVPAAPDFYVRLLAAQRASLTPAAVQAVLKRLLAPMPRLLVVGPQPFEGGTAATTQALLAAQKIAGGAAEQLRAVSFDQLVLKGTASKITDTIAVPALDAQRVRFANGVELVFKRTAFEKDRVHVRVEIGHGLLGQPRGDPGLAWTAAALPASGIGPFSAPELERVTAGRQVAFAAQETLSALALTGATNGADLSDMLKLMTGQIEQPRFDATTIGRTREATLATYASTFSQPVGVLQAFGGPALHGGDARFAQLPSREAIAALTPDVFRRFWSERLGEGPIRVVIVGDVDPARVIAAVGSTLGTLASRAAGSTIAADVVARSPSSSVILRHQGDPAQALILRVFPTQGLLENPAVSDALGLAATIAQTRLTEGFRETEGGSYSPLAASSQSAYLPRFGVVIAGAQVQTSRVDAFGTALDATLDQLAVKGPSTDEFMRAQSTAVSAAIRSREDNGWWLGVLANDLTPARIADLSGAVDRLKALQPGAVRAVAARYLMPKEGFTIAILPEVGSSEAKK